MAKNKKVWFITGAGRGMGAEIAKVALANGNQVVATGRNTNNVKAVLGNDENLFIVKLDITNSSDVNTAVKDAIAKFGKIDVLVNNASNFYGGYFEELTPEQINNQLETTLIGPMNITRAVLPIMRKQSSGHIISISSGAGISGFEFNTAYAASKFGLEGWMESLQPEVSPFGINTTIVNPGMFRTGFLNEKSAKYAEPTINDYNERRKISQGNFESQNGNQAGDPVKLAKAIVDISNEEQPPLRFIAGEDAVEIVEKKISDFQSQLNAYRELSISLSHDDV
ncbi:SDR family NAD(P)-dependent oxidoreductase [Mammaliicoccus sp. Dog046]|uniref:SDR family NAD(P)-dependent oxidoreductase n=1 Tax=Mammaliicoccus sp. Dog046 TaxID=3034233 RepID=UPI002B25F796|nr:SDR family NAD(P)-dependent oxidoreductase [Mammaliicoccus sp. Dog046]WQK86248.1 SDR family NAD(P)-dependent oxidoreductase [Mammaliicoccus sp. Dog046]